MKYLKLFENFDFTDDDFDFEEEDDNTLNVGDLVTISDLYKMYPNWSKSSQYRKAVEYKTPLKITNIKPLSTSDSRNHGNKMGVHFSYYEVFYVPEDVCQKIRN